MGTGFHPELTGRENIYLNGAILGMRRREITRQFDAIVDFSGVEHFLDLPVKRYSSGMQVRLAFAVAAHLEPEILVVDEVLAVGDAEFQKKCLGKMGDVARLDPRTILFVSHNMAAIEALCQRCIYLEKGRVAFDGSTADAISRYLSAGSESHESAVGVFDLDGEPGNERGYLRRLRVLSNTGQPVDSVRMGDGFTLIVEVDGLCGDARHPGRHPDSFAARPDVDIDRHESEATARVSPHHDTEEFVFELDRMPSGSRELHAHRRGVGPGDTHAPDGRSGRQHQRDRGRHLQQRMGALAVGRLPESSSGSVGLGKCLRNRCRTGATVASATTPPR